MAYRDHFDYHGGCFEDYEEVSHVGNCYGQDHTSLYSYDHGWDNHGTSSWQGYEVIQEDYHGWEMQPPCSYQSPPFPQVRSTLEITMEYLNKVSNEFMASSNALHDHAMVIEDRGNMGFQKFLSPQEKSKLEVAMEKMAETTNQFIATSNAFYEEHAMIIENQRALDLHQLQPPQEERINLEDVYARLDEATCQFVAQEQVMSFPDQETYFEDLEVENEHMENALVDNGVDFEVYPPISCSYGMEEQWTQVPNLQEVKTKMVEKVVEITWGKGEQVVIEENNEREDNLCSFYPLDLPSPFSQERQDTSFTRMAPDNRENHVMHNHLEDSFRAWLVQVVESLDRIVVNLASLLKAPYALIAPRSIVELRRQHPP